jgi:hypothetical protein
MGQIIQSINQKSTLDIIFLSIIIGHMKINIVDRFNDGTPLLVEVLNRVMTRTSQSYTVKYSGRVWVTEKIHPFRGQSVDISRD